jgi:hypothetical protein
MTAENIFHQHVRRTLEKDGWTITDDPLSVRWPESDEPLHPESGPVIGAEQGGEKIAVAVTSFLGASQIVDLQNALGLFSVHRYALRRTEPARKLFLAIRDDVYIALFESSFGEELRVAEKIRILVFNPLREEVVRWL